jgi:diguanylate cyclase (GGDEF)-like protein
LAHAWNDPVNLIRTSELDPLASSGESVALLTILDSLDALIYVADIQTGELLFVNEYGRKRWGEPRQLKCWEYLQSGQTARCAFCTNPLLLDAAGQPAGIHVWEFQNTVDGHWYQCRDQAIRWVDGRIVRLEIATDITDRKTVEQALLEARRQAEALARTDDLTGLSNRRAFFELGEQILRQARRGGSEVSVIMFDIDYFKSINDTYGHATGDRVLRKVARVVGRRVRDCDVFARLGGEEFGLLLPDTRLAQALATAERLRSEIGTASVKQNGQLISCTASFGIAMCRKGRSSLDQLLAAADHALFRAKHQGRNRVELAEADAIG